MPKILIIRFSSIGDIVLTTPVIRCLKLQLKAELHFLTKRAYHQLLSSNPYIDKVHSIEKKVSEILTALKTERFDHIVDLHKNLRSAQVKWALSAPSSSFDKLNVEKWLRVHLHINRLPKLHIVDRYLQSVAHLGVHNDGAGLDYFVPTDIQLSTHPQLVPYLQEHRIIVFAIGAAHATKRLPCYKIIETCTALATSLGQSPQPHLIALIGGTTETATGKQVVTAVRPTLRNPTSILNLCGATSLHQSAALVKRADVVITHDTGMMHIAAAFRKHIVSVWGNTISDFGMYPYYPQGMNKNTSIAVSQLSCRPCSKIGHAQCPKGHFRCMQDIDPQQIVEAVNAVLD